MPIPLNDGVHWVHVVANGFAAVHASANGVSRTQQAYLGYVANPQAAGERSLEQQGVKTEGEKVKGEILGYMRTLERMVMAMPLRR